MKLTEAKKIVRKQLVYFNNRELAAKYSADFGREDPVGVLTFGYTDHINGQKFEVLALAVADEGMVGFTGKNDKRASISYEEVRNEEVFILRDIDTTDWLDKINANESENAVDEIVIAFRNEQMFDEFRDDVNPDVVSIILFKQGLNMEYIKARFEMLDETGLHGVLVEEPKQDFSVHKGDTVDFFMNSLGPDTNTLVCPLK